MTEPYLSILIPTRNRERYLRALLTLLHESEIQPDDLEVVVSDNSDEPITPYFTSDRRFKWVRPPDILSMAANWEYAFLASRGEWIAYIGDDDGISRLGLALAIRKLRTTSADAVVFNHASFFWPGVVSKDGILTFWQPRSEFFSYKFSFNPKISFFNHHFPTPHSRTIIRRNLITSIKDSTGRIFSSKIPDINLAWSIALRTKKIQSSSVTTFIVGTSPESNGLNHGRSPNSSQQKEFWGATDLNWLPELGIGKPPVSYLVYFEPLLQAQRVLGQAVLFRPASVIWKSFFSSNRYMDLTRYFLENFPRFRLQIYIASVSARLFSRISIFLSRVLWALHRSIFEKSTYNRKVLSAGSTIREASYLLDEAVYGKLF